MRENNPELKELWTKSNKIPKATRWIRNKCPNLNIKINYGNLNCMYSGRKTVCSECRHMNTDKVGSLQFTN